MIKNTIKTTVFAGFCCLVFCCLIMPQHARSEEKKASLNKEERAKIDYMMSLDTDKDIRSLLAQPVKVLAEKLLKSIEEKQNIEIKRSSMVKTDKCLLALLTSTAHLAKISCGHKIQRVNIRLEATTTRASVWNQWRFRKLETPKLTFTLYYDDPTVEPSEISCQGYKYH